MSIPGNIVREHILKAIERINDEGVPLGSDSQYYDLIFNSKRYPPKLIISYANKFANGVDLDRTLFDGGKNTEAFKLLEKEGFVITEKNNINMALPRIFIAPRSGEQSSQNFAKTIDGGYLKADIIDYLSIEDKTYLLNEVSLMIWGVKPSLKPRWDKMEIDDWVIFYQHGKITYVGKLLYKSHNKALADNLWGPLTGQDGISISWEYVFFVKELQQIDMPYKIMADLAGYAGAVVQGFQPYSEIGVQNIINQYVTVENFFFNKSQIEKNMSKKIFYNTHDKFINATKTKPFVLLAGLSGTGKSRLVRTIAFKTCTNESLKNNINKPGNFELIPVRPNWHDSSELIGYVSRIAGEKYILTTFLKFISKAWRYLDVPFFLCMDEMNLAPVEQYFAEFLSIIETRQVKEDIIQTDYILSKASFENDDLYNTLLIQLELNEDQRFSDGISIPPNLVVVGTVNMDETTHSFSRKVLDRAMTIEMNQVDLTIGLKKSENDWQYPKDIEDFISIDDVVGTFTSGAEVYDKFDEGAEVIEFLNKINIALDDTPFKIAYRVRDEFLIYCYYSKIKNTNYGWLKESLDDLVSMKILSRIEGDEAKTNEVITKLQNILKDNYDRSNNKLIEMGNRLKKSGYTSYWT